MSSPAPLTRTNRPPPPTPASDVATRIFAGRTHVAVAVVGEHDGVGRARRKRATERRLEKLVCSAFCARTRCSNAARHAQALELVVGHDAAPAQVLKRSDGRRSIRRRRSPMMRTRSGGREGGVDPLLRPPSTLAPEQSGSDHVCPTRDRRAANHLGQEHA
jgi:hypothetical protein